MHSKNVIIDDYKENFLNTLAQNQKNLKNDFLEDTTEKIIYKKRRYILTKNNRKRKTDDQLRKLKDVFHSNLN